MLESLVELAGMFHTCNEVLASTFVGPTPIDTLLGEGVSRPVAVDATARHHNDCLVVASANVAFRKENI